MTTECNINIVDAENGWYFIHVLRLWNASGVLVCGFLIRCAYTKYTWFAVLHVIISTVCIAYTHCIYGMHLVALAQTESAI